MVRKVGVQFGSRGPVVHTVWIVEGYKIQSRRFLEVRYQSVVMKCLVVCMAMRAGEKGFSNLRSDT
jgi:hypothetical protein